MTCSLAGTGGHFRSAKGNGRVEKAGLSQALNISMRFFGTALACERADTTNFNHLNQ
jgi:hypothetical protein